MIITLPYRERAAVSIVAASSSRPETQVIEAASVANWRPMLRRPRKEVRNSTSVSVTADAVRILGNRTRNPGVSLRAMHMSKVLFGRSASRALTRTGCAVLGFPGASLEIFSSEPGSSRVSVLHCVDAHPRSHNEALLSHFTPKESRAELYPGWVVDRIESEIEAADALLVPSALVAGQMLSNGVAAEKIHIEPYGVDFGHFHPKYPTGSAQRVNRSGRPRIIYVGQISRRKGINFLLEAVRNLPMDLELVGNVFDPNVLKDRPDNVSVTSSLTHEELAVRYWQADAFVIPSVEDACSLVALEAVAAGLPVIGTNMNGAMEIVPAGSSSIVEPGSTASLREALQDVQVLSSERRALNAAIAGQSKIRDWELYGATIVSKLETLGS